MTVVENIRRGNAEPKDIDYYVDIWHNSDSDITLREYLGMTVDQYSKWLKNPDAIYEIIKQK